MNASQEMTLLEIIDKINDISMNGNHPFGELQRLRGKSLRIKPKTLTPFAKYKFFEDGGYAFHSGGTTELQFNIGNEDATGNGKFRYGIAFSFQPTRFEPDPVKKLKPVVDRFNDYLWANPAFFDGYEMWVWDGVKNYSYSPKVIPIKDDLIKQGNFIFIGKFINKEQDDIDDGDIETIVNEFDYLFPAYEKIQFGENNEHRQEIKNNFKDLETEIIYAIPTLFKRKDYQNIFNSLIENALDIKQWKGYCYFRAEHNKYIVKIILTSIGENERQLAFTAVFDISESTWNEVRFPSELTNEKVPDFFIPLPENVNNEINKNFFIPLVDLNVISEETIVKCLPNLFNEGHLAEYCATGIMIDISSLNINKSYYIIEKARSAYQAQLFLFSEIRNVFIRVIGTYVAESNSWKDVHALPWGGAVPSNARPYPHKTLPVINAENSPAGERGTGIKPNRNAEIPCLNVKEYANALTKLFRAAEEDFSFALFGKWGRGKTYLMKLVTDNLKKDHNYEIINFSAWKYRTTPSLWVHLYENFVDRINEQGALSRFFSYFRIGVQKHNWWIVLGVLALLLLCIPLLFDISSVYVSRGSLGLGLGGVVVSILKLWKNVSTVWPQFIKKYGAVVSFKEELGIQEVIGSNLKYLIKGWLSHDFSKWLYLIPIAFIDMIICLAFTGCIWIMTLIYPESEIIISIYSWRWVLILPAFFILIFCILKLLTKISMTTPSMTFRHICFILFHKIAEIINMKLPLHLLLSPFFYLLKSIDQAWKRIKNVRAMQIWNMLKAIWSFLNKPFTFKTILVLVHILVCKLDVLQASLCSILKAIWFFLNKPFTIFKPILVLVHILECKLEALQASQSVPTKILLVVDDLDRCEMSEMLCVIESLVLLLDDDMLKKKLQIAMLVEEDAIRLAICKKYIEMIRSRNYKKINDKCSPAKESKEIKTLPTHKTHPHDLDDQLYSKIGAEAIDENVEKLFLCTLKLEDLSPDERWEVMFGFLKQDNESLEDRNIENKTAVDTTVHGGNKKENINQFLQEEDEDEPLPSNGTTGHGDGILDKMISQSECDGIKKLLYEWDDDSIGKWGPRALMALKLKFLFARLLLEELNEKSGNKIDIQSSELIRVLGEELKRQTEKEVPEQSNDPCTYTYIKIIRQVI